MKRISVLVAIILASAFVGSWLGNIAHAQGASTVFQVSGAYSTHTACVLPPVGQTGACLASDGLWISINGGAFTQVGVPVAVGVTSLNGKTGDLKVTAVSAAPTVTATSAAPAVTVTVQ